MSDAADWVAAAGGVVGAIGGPAGMWAAWNVHRQNQRRRFGPPEELVGLLAKLIDIAGTAQFSYRNAAWYEESGIRDVTARVDELKHLVSDPLLRGQLTRVSVTASQMRSALTNEMQTAELNTSIVARQARYAALLKESAAKTLKDLRRKL